LKLLIHYRKGERKAKRPQRVVKIVQGEQFLWYTLTFTFTYELSITHWWWYCSLLQHQDQNVHQK